jgi:hypothetical protein
LKENSPLQDMNLINRLSEWKNKNISIRKEQNRDVDMTTMTLEDAKFHQRQGTIDDYVSPLTIQLHGTGSVKTDNGDHQPLPYFTFEIPVDDNYKLEMGQDSVRIETVDEKYTISTNL